MFESVSKPARPRKRIAIRLPWVLRYAPAFRYLLITSAPPDATAAAFAAMEREAVPDWSPLPLVQPRIVPSVGGTNVYVRLRVRRFWRIVVGGTVLVWLAMAAYADVPPLYGAPLPLASVAVVVIGLQYTRYRIASMIARAAERTY